MPRITQVAGLHVEESDPPSPASAAPPLVILPGLLTAAPHLRRLVAPLAARRRVVVIEALGGGRSEIPDPHPEADPEAGLDASPYAWPAQTARLIAVLDHLDCARADVLGLSLGGVWAQHLARLHPDRVARVALCATSARLAARERCVVEGLRAVLAAPVPDLAIARTLIPFLFSPRHLSRPGAVVTAEVFLTRDPVPRTGVLGQLEAMLAHDLDGDLGPGVVRAVIGGSEDLLMHRGVTERLARAAGVEPTFVEEAGHSVWFEAPARLSAIVMEAMEAMEG